MAAGSTYTPIATTTVSGSSTTTYTFSSIPSTYTDLILVSSAQMSGTGTTGSFRFNGDTGSNYSFTYLYGNGTSAASGRQSNQTAGIWDSWADRLSNTMFETDILHIMNYSNTTTYKTALSRSNSSVTTEAAVNLWRSTAAINSLTVYISTGNFVAGSTFTLYGIQAA